MHYCLEHLPYPGQWDTVFGNMAKTSRKIKPGPKGLHDPLAKRLLSNKKYCTEIISLALSPSEFALFKWDSLQHETNTYINRQLKKKFTDVVVSVELRGSKSKKIRIIFLMEHKSREYPGLLQQLLEYQTRIYERHKCPIIPILLYHGEKKTWCGPLSFQDSLEGLTPAIRKKFGKDILNFKCRLLNLHDIEVQRKEKRLQSFPGLYILRSIWKLTRKHVEEIFRSSEKLDDRERREIIDPVLSYIEEYHPSFDWDELEQIERKIINEEENRVVALLETTLEKAQKKGIRKGRIEGRTEGRAEGRTEGRTEGRLEEKKEVALRMLERGSDVQFVIECTGLEEKELQKLKTKTT